MNNFLQKLKTELYKFSYGRYGNDELSRFLLYSALALFVLNAVTKVGIFYTISLVLIVYNCFRSLSKNHQKRYMERQVYLLYKGKFDSKFALQKRKWNERKTHKFFKCPSCKTVVRVPKGRGKIEISCPKCHNTFIKKS